MNDLASEKSGREGGYVERGDNRKGDSGRYSIGYDNLMVCKNKVFQ